MSGDTKTEVTAPTRTTTPVSIATDIVQKLRVICAHRGVTQSDHLDPLIRDAVAREYRKVVAELADAGGES